MMTKLGTGTGLHLPSLSIKGFRGIADLSIPRLGQVTLIAGMNGVGKTTLLEAVRLYAARGNYSVLWSILRHREELTTITDEDGNEISAPNFEALAYGRHPLEDSCISIGPVENGPKLNIRFHPTLGQQEMPMFKSAPDSEQPLLVVEFQGATEEIFAAHLVYRHGIRRIPRRLRRHRDESRMPNPIQCESIGPSVMGNDDMARFWDSVALTEHEMQAVNALRLIYGHDVDRVAMVGDQEQGYAQGYTRRAFVRIKNQDAPVPLKSLGDGAVRIFTTALAIASSSNGFLVIDEAENGIHHSLQADFWKTVMATSLENNVQVLATTHSWDCVVGFSQAASGVEEADGCLIRIDRGGEKMRSVEYTGEDLRVATQQQIEVR